MRRILTLTLAGAVGGLVCAGLVLGVLAVTRPDWSSARPTPSQAPSPPPQATPAALATIPPETCILGHPNSSAVIVVELTGAGAADVCNDLTNPIRTSSDLRGTQALASHPWAPYQACRFQRYGLTWTIWDAVDSPIPSGPFARRPGGDLCPA